MRKLVINAPKRKTPTAEKMIENGKGPRYAIWDSLLDRVYDSSSQRVRQGCGVVLLCKNRELRWEGMLVRLNRIEKTKNGIWRYDVHMEGMKPVEYKPEKLNFCGVAVIECGCQPKRT